jgi:hypothetical protein
MPWLMYLVSRYEDSELEGDDGEDDEDDEEEEEEVEEEEEKEEEGRFHPQLQWPLALTTNARLSPLVS